MGTTGLGSGQHAALTQKYGDLLDQLAKVIQEVLNSVTDATATGIRGEFARAWEEAARAVVHDGMQAHHALKEVQDLLSEGRKIYVRAEHANTRPFTNLL